MKYIRKPVEVIAIFDIEGNPSPMRLRCSDEEEETIVIKVDKILRRDIDKFAGNPMIRYTCESLMAGEAKVFEVRYEVHSCKWYLYKI